MDDSAPGVPDGFHLRDRRRGAVSKKSDRDADFFWKQPRNAED